MSVSFNDDAAYESGPCEVCGRQTGVYHEDYKMYVHEFCLPTYEADRWASRCDAAHDEARDHG